MASAHASEYQHTVNTTPPIVGAPATRQPNKSGTSFYASYLPKVTLGGIAVLPPVACRAAATPQRQNGHAAAHATTGRRAHGPWAAQARSPEWLAVTVGQLPTPHVPATVRLNRLPVHRHHQPWGSEG